ncbi:hypothetical protein KJ673_02560 [Patescibacteria group bacterium]|nr:hypothetical protein [Patescibacteria group bacterium]MBU4453330.1 hypothetical protein [Patescibacteria group bacterium]MCG2687752.1 hypothetical protein [Candidatus Parcubacteria bacterium]
METIEREPVKSVREQLYAFTKSVDGNIIEQSGSYTIEAGKIRAEVDVEQGKNAFKLYDGDELIMQHDDMDLESIIKNIGGYAFPQEKLNPSEARQPLGDKEKLYVDEDSGKIKMENNQGASKAA